MDQFIEKQGDSAIMALVPEKRTRRHKKSHRTVSGGQ
jgi:hypothetical protein